MTSEFYRVFKDTLIPKSNDESRIGKFIYFFKKRGALKNYRPISMLNTDFKILAKMLANRLKKVLPGIITKNQSYSIIGRKITDKVSNIREKISYMTENNKEGYIISLDLEKAFDRVE